MKIKKVLMTNRGEIVIRIFRACVKIGLKTIGIYTYENRYSLYRYKADESYQIGKQNDPLKPYLDIDNIIAIAKRNEVDAIILDTVFYLRMQNSPKNAKKMASFYWSRSNHI